MDTSLVNEPPSRQHLQNSANAYITPKERQSTRFKRFFRSALNALPFIGSGHAPSLEHDMAELLEEHDPEGTQVGSEERTILSNVLALKDLRVEDVMIPRSDIIAVDASITLTNLKKILIKERHTRLPVYQDTLDQMVGFVHIKDLIPLLGSRRKFDITQLLRKILVVPPSMKARDLLMHMRAKRSHIVLVVDEYGATHGLVTLEDVLEEIIGNIDDEHDTTQAIMCRELTTGIFDVNARMPVKELEAVLETSLSLEDDDEDDYDTVGGLVFIMMDRVPENGETISHPAGFTFEVLDADARRIKRIIVKKQTT